MSLFNYNIPFDPKPLIKSTLNYLFGSSFIRKMQFDFQEYSRSVRVYVTFKAEIEESDMPSAMFFIQKLIELLRERYRGRISVSIDPGNTDRRLIRGYLLAWSQKESRRSGVNSFKFYRISLLYSPLDKHFN